MSAHCPPERPSGAGRASRDPSPESARGCLGGIDYGNQLEVGIAERHDHVGRAPSWVTATHNGGKTVTRLDLLSGLCEVCNGDQHVVELHADERTARGGSASVQRVTNVRRLRLRIPTFVEVEFPHCGCWPRHTCALGPEFGRGSSHCHRRLRFPRAGPSLYRRTLALRASDV